MNMPIILHELKQLFYNRKAWISLAILQAILAIIFNWLLLNFVKTQASTQIMHYGITEDVLHPFYGWYSLLMLLFVPIFASQAICAEKQNGTIINYYCAPISAAKVIIAKFFALNIVLITTLLLASIMPLFIIVSGKLDWGLLFSTLVGIFCMLNAAMAFCLGLACFIKSTLRANFLLLIGLAAFILLEWAAQYTGAYALSLQNFALLKPLKPFLAGLISLRHIVYYLFITIMFLYIGIWGFNAKEQYS